MLAVTGLSVRYGSATALRGVTLRVEPGEIVAVIGRNGAGKTTLLRAISGLVPVASGRITFAGREITGWPACRVARLPLAHVPQGRQVFGDQTVEDNLILGAYQAVWRDRRTVRLRLDQQYSAFPKLYERRRQLAGTLSGGEQQMLVIARAMMADPPFLAMDEPSMGLAPLYVKTVLDSVVRLRREGKTILLVEQLATAALAIADRAYILQTGEVKHTGPCRDLLADGRVLQSYLGR